MNEKVNLPVFLHTLAHYSSDIWDLMEGQIDGDWCKRCTTTPPRVISEAIVVMRLYPLRRGRESGVLKSKVEMAVLGDL